MNEDQKLVTIGQFESEFEAQQARDCLEEAGIHAVLFGATLGAAFPFSGAGKPDFIQLQTFEADRDQALEVLEECFSHTEDEADDEDVDAEGSGESE